VKAVQKRAQQRALVSAVLKLQASFPETYLPVSGMLLTQMTSTSYHVIPWILHATDWYFLINSLLGDLEGYEKIIRDQ
jgi:hypothetical protein